MDNTSALAWINNLVDSLAGVDVAEAVVPTVTQHLGMLGEPDQLAVRKIDGGGEVLVIAGDRFAAIRVFATRTTPPVIQFESRRLKDVIVSFETTDFRTINGVQTSQTWSFRFPDCSSVSIQGVTREGVPDDLEQLARAALAASGSSPR